jgi:phage tail P2-like protein
VKAIASTLADSPLASALLEVVAGRWDSFNLAPLMAYLVDTCAPAALPYLAEQLDVDGLHGFALAQTDEQRREVIKRSVPLHKLIGTPAALREACRSVGVGVIDIVEGVPSDPPQPQTDWARFRVLLAAEPDRAFTAEQSRKLRMFVEFYKPLRSHLVEVGYYLPLAEAKRVLGGPPARRERVALALFTKFTARRYVSVAPQYVWLTADSPSADVDVASNAQWEVI